MASRSLSLISSCLIACSNPAPSEQGGAGAPGVGQTSRMRSVLERPVIAGGETSDFGDGEPPVCTVTSVTAIDAARAGELGFPIDATLELFAREQRSPLHWGSCSEEAPSADTTLFLGFELDQIEFVESEPFLPAPPGWRCAGYLRYRVLVTLRTEDGGLAGRFYLQLGQGGALEPENGASIFAPRELCAYGALPDLRNYAGWQTVSVDLARPHWSSMRTNLCVSESGTSGSLVTDIDYADEASPDWGGEGLALWPALEGGSGCEAPQPRPSSHSVALDDYPGSTSPPTTVLSVRATAVEPAADVQVTVRIDGVLVEQGLVAPGTSIDLGRWPEGTLVDAEVENVNAAGAVGSEILVDNCFATSERCSAPGCTARAHHVVSGRPCRGDE